jgi:hypothetical protein
MFEGLSIDSQGTIERKLALTTFFNKRVLKGDSFICKNYLECKNSHQGIFYEGQLHHVGDRYEVTFNEKPFRIMVVGQEYGHEPAKVGMDARSEMVLQDTGLLKTFSERNPHMRGVTSALRLLYGLPLGSDRSSELMQTDAERFHLFEAFALVNYLLCSAVDHETGRRGKATQTMLRNCQDHFKKAVEILDPSIMVIQSKGFWKTIANAFERVTQITDNLYRARLGEEEIIVAVFAHPSTPDNRSNWGRSADTPYLLNTVAPTLKQARELTLGEIGNLPAQVRTKAECKPPKRGVTYSRRSSINNHEISYEIFDEEMISRLRELVPSRFMMRKPKFKVRSNRMQIYLDRITGSHYEICLRKQYHEMALHFESTPERSLERRQAFDPLLGQIRQEIGHRVNSGPLENRGWMRIWIERPVRARTQELLDEYVDIFARFIEATFPTLEEIYKGN